MEALPLRVDLVLPLNPSNVDWGDTMLSRTPPRRRTPITEDGHGDQRETGSSGPGGQLVQARVGGNKLSGVLRRAKADLLAVGVEVNQSSDNAESCQSN